MFGSPALIGATIVTGLVAGFLFLLGYAAEELTKNPECRCKHRRSEHDMLMNLHGPCKRCMCRAYWE